MTADETADALRSLTGSVRKVERWRNRIYINLIHPNAFTNGSWGDLATKLYLDAEGVLVVERCAAPTSPEFETALAAVLELAEAHCVRIKTRHPRPLKD